MWKALVFKVCAANATPELAEAILDVGNRYEVSPHLILAMVWTESRCDPTAKGRDGDTGLMQVIPKWHKERMARLGVTDLSDPLQNLTVGVDYLVDLGAHGITRDALAAYNGGPRRPPASYKYADKVLALCDSW